MRRAIPQSRARLVRRLAGAVSVLSLVCVPACSGSQPTAHAAAAPQVLKGDPLTAADPAPQTAGTPVAVTPSGRSVTDGAVRIDVPAKAVPQGHTFRVVRTTAIPAQRGEIFGQPASVEHDAPLAAPATIRWTLPTLTDVQRGSLVLAKWDPAAKAWAVKPKQAFRIDGNTLTATVGDFSFWDWIANVGQAVGQVTGARASGPTCSKNGNKDDGLPAWVRGVVNPSQGTGAAAIRVCFEPDHADLVTTRVVNNRPFTQQLSMTSGNQQWAWTWPGPDTYDIDAAIAIAARAAFDSPTSYLLPPLSENAVGIDRPAQLGAVFIAATAKVNVTTVLVDVVRFAFDQIDVGGFENPLVSALAQAVYQCGGKQLLGRPDLSSPSAIVRAAVDAIGSCASEIRDPESEFGKLFENLSLDAIKKLGPKGDDFVIKANRLAYEADSAFKVLTYGKVAFYVSDQLQNAAVGPLTLSIRGNGQPPVLGQWTPSCSNTDADSNAVFKNLALQDEFSDKSKELWQFAQWASEAARAVAPLAKCSASYLSKLADALPGGWQDQKAAGVVADKIRALSSQGGQWNAPSLTFTETSLGAVRLGMSLAAAQQAAGMVFDGQGDGAIYPNSLPNGSAHLWVTGDPVAMIGAGGLPPDTTQKISFHGIALGDSAAKVTAAYPSARYAPPQGFGQNPLGAGYVVTLGATTVVFNVDGGQNGRVSGIKIGGAGLDLQPSTYNG